MKRANVWGGSRNCLLFSWVSIKDWADFLFFLKKYSRDTLVIIFSRFAVAWLFFSLLDWMCHHCRDPPLLLPGIFLLDVSRGGPAVPHARGGVRERILAEEVLLRVWLPLSCHCGCRLHSYRLQELWDRESVSGLTQRVSFCKEPHVSEHYRLHSGSWSFFCQIWEAVTFFFTSFERGRRVQQCGFLGGGGYIKAFLLKVPPVTSCL